MEVAPRQRHECGRQNQRLRPEPWSENDKGKWEIDRAEVAALPGLDRTENFRTIRGVINEDKDQGTNDRDRPVAKETCDDKGGQSPRQYEPPCESRRRVPRRRDVGFL